MKTTSTLPAPRGKRRAYPVYSVTRFSRQDRTTLAVEGSGLTLAEAGELASTLRGEHAGDEDLFGFMVQTMPLGEQAVILNHPADDGGERRSLLVSTTEDLYDPADALAAVTEIDADIDRLKRERASILTQVSHYGSGGLAGYALGLRLAMLEA